MKKRYFYILALFAVIPVAAWFAFSEVVQAGQKYFISDETGNRSELGNIQCETYDHINDYNIRKITVSSAGIEVSKANYLGEYGSYKNVVENKDLLRGKCIDDNVIDENEKYAVNASNVINKETVNHYIDLNIKNKESGSIIRVKHYVDAVDYVEKVRIQGNYVEVFTTIYNRQNSKNSDSIKLYKFDISTGKLVKEDLISDKITNSSKILLNGEKIYIICSYDGDMKRSISYMLVYDEKNDTTNKVNLPRDLNICRNVVLEDGIIYSPTDNGEVIGFNEKGKVVGNFKVGDNISNEDSMTVKNDKIYLVRGCKAETLGKAGRRISVYSLKDNICLYSASFDVYSKYSISSEFVAK